MSLFLFLCLLSGLSAFSTAESIRDLIFRNEYLDRTLLPEMCKVAGVVDGVLDNTSLRDLAFYIPTDESILASPTLAAYTTGLGNTVRPDTWLQHLHVLCMAHLNPVISNDTTITVTDAYTAENGVMFIIQDVLVPVVGLESLARLDLETKYAGAFQDQVEAINGSLAALEMIRPNGATFLGCSSLSLLQAETGLLTKGSFEYSIVPGNYYFSNEMEKPEYQKLVMPGSKYCPSHMWISNRNGRLCYNDACVLNESPQYLASNGVGYIMDHCLSCPGVGMLTLYAAEITDRSIDRMASLLEASGWDLNSLGNNGTITLMVPKNFGFEAVFQTKEDWDRILLDSRWRGHVRAILRSCILDEALNTTQMKQRFNAGDVNLTTMSGEQKVLGYNEDSDSLTFSNARISFSDIVGVDGYSHIIDLVPWPNAYLRTAYNYGRIDPRFAVHFDNMDGAFLNGISTRKPITVLYVPNAAYEDLDIGMYNSREALKSLMNNHIFDDNLSCDDFRALAGLGVRVTSANGAMWRIRVPENSTYPCFDVLDKTVFGQACITQCDIYVKNGIVHILDKIMLEETSGFTSAPTSSAMPIWSVAPTVVASVAPSVPTNSPTVFTETGRPTIVSTSDAPDRVVWGILRMMGAMMTGKIVLAWF